MCERSEPKAERWALWPDGTMCPAEEVGAMLRSPCAFSDDYEWVWVMPDDDLAPGSRRIDP